MIGHSEGIGLGDKALADEKDRGYCDERFAELVARQSRFVFRLAHAVLRNTHDSEDVVQEVFLKLYRSPDWSHLKDERADLARIAWRVSVARLSTKRDSEFRNNDSRAESPSLDETPEQAAVQSNWSAVVHKLIDALPEELRLPLALSAIDDLNSCEISKLLEIPQGTVRTRIMKARIVLKEKLAVLMGDRHGR
jgi:RNA polymerase sigma-70 factor (ECF subfamily)